MKDFHKAKNQFIFYSKMCDKKLKFSLFVNLTHCTFFDTMQLAAVMLHYTVILYYVCTCRELYILAWGIHYNCVCIKNLYSTI